MNMANLNLDIIKKAHEDDIAAYKNARHTRPSPQHLHRHWLLKKLSELKAQIKVLEDK